MYRDKPIKYHLSQGIKINVISDKSDYCHDLMVRTFYMMQSCDWDSALRYDLPAW